MEFGLDHGTELDTEKVETVKPSEILENPIVPGQPPEVTKQNTIVAALESQAVSLALLIEDMQKVGGMNRAMAMEAIRIDPSLETVPLNRFSEFPTATRYQASLESFTQKLKEIIKKIVDYIKKAIDYVILKITGKVGQKADLSIIKLQVEKQRREIQQAKEASDKAMNIFTELKSKNVYLHEVTPNDVKSNRGLDLMLYRMVANSPQERLAQSLLKSGNPVIQDLANKGENTQFVIKSAKMLVDISDLIVERVEMMKQILGAKRHDDKMFVEITEKIKKSASFKYKNGTYETEDIPEILENIQSRLDSQPIQKISDLFNTVSKLYDDNRLEEFSENLGNLTFNLFKLRGGMEDVQDQATFFESKGVESPATNEAIISTVAKLQAEISAVARAANFLDTYLNLLKGVSYDVHRLAGKMKRVVDQLYTKEELEKAPSSEEEFRASQQRQAAARARGRPW